MTRPHFLCALLTFLAACGGKADVPAATPDAGDDATPDGALPLDSAPADTPDAPSTAIDYLIITADPLFASAQRYRDYRLSTGQVVELAKVSDVLHATTDPTQAAQAIHDFVKARWTVRSPSKPFYLLILGDADSNVAVPTDGSLVPVGHVIDAETKLPVSSDNVYADMDGDDVPDLAVGRIPAHSDDEVDNVRTKVAAYDATYAVGAWNRRLSVFASTSGYGEPIDTMIEQLVFQIVEEVPYDFDFTMTYAKQQSPYVWIPEKFSDKVYERIDEGALMVTYVGHGYSQGFATLAWGSRSFPILDTTQLTKITAAPKAPILSLIACATGAFDTSDSVSEKVLRSAVGPVAVMSSTENSSPYPNAIFIRELGQAMLVLRTPTVGGAFVVAKQRLLNVNDALRQTIDSQVGALLDAPSRDAEKHSHLHMYTLFGDPAMRIAYPAKAGGLVVPSGSVAPGTSFSVSAAIGGFAATGKATVTLESTRSTVLGTIKTVPADGDPTRDGVIQSNYVTANDKVVARADATLANGALSTKLDVPAGLVAGDYHVKVYADDGTHDAVLSAIVTVKP